MYTSKLPRKTAPSPTANRRWRKPLRNAVASSYDFNTTMVTRGESSGFSVNDAATKLSLPNRQSAGPGAISAGPMRDFSSSVCSGFSAADDYCS